MSAEETSGNPRPPSADRVIRVFISSTFRDMMRERDLLVKKVFPELRRKCAKRFVTFTEVDLRWGITEAQANEGQVLPLCLAEIERSRPYFIGLLGERYGWIPDTIRPEIIAREPWLNEHVRDRTSVTELEILHGVLNNPKMEGYAFFYFRDPAYVNDCALTDDERWDVVEHDIKADIEKYGPAEAARRTEERKAKLSALKQRIRNSKLKLAEPYPNPKTVARLVRRQFNRLIDSLYPEDQTPDLLVQERMAHEAHAKNKLFACINRPVHLTALTAFAAPLEHDGRGLVVTGESGGGKTALLAAWARDWAKSHPEDFLFQHYFGATPDSAAPEGFLRRLLGELKSRFGITEDIPANSEKLRDALPVWLAQTIGRGRIVLVLDGLNQIQGSEPDRRLLFLPCHFPPHVAVLASALPSPALDALRERGWTEYNLPLASEAEVDAMVGEYLKIHARTLESVLRHELVMATGAKNPLFLRTVLEELRQFGSYEQLPRRVRHYLEADNPKDLFLRVLTRWQEDFDGNDPEQDQSKLNLVRRALTHLWAARQGLSEPEWQDLLGDGKEPLPRAFWTPLFLALEPHLSQRDGLFAFGHNFLRQAVEDEFVASGDLQQAAHLAVADYFDGHEHQREMTLRKAAEWPYQLRAAEAWGRLEVCLTDIPLFLALFNERTKWELIGYWNPLHRLGRDMGDCYARVYEQWIATPSNANEFSFSVRVGIFLVENGFYDLSEPMLIYGLRVCERVMGPQHSTTLTCTNHLARLLELRGDYMGAERLYRRALVTSERTLGVDHPDTMASMNNLALLLLNKGEYERAEGKFRSALEAQERVLGVEHPFTLASVTNLAETLRRKGENEEAETLLWRALRSCDRVLGSEHPYTLLVVNNLAGMLEGKAAPEEVEVLYRRALEGFERALGPAHPYALTSMNNLAMFMKKREDYEEAEQLCRRALAGRERVLGSMHFETLTSVHNLGGLMQGRGDYGQAVAFYRRALEGRERLLGPAHPDTIASLHNLAACLCMNGNYAESELLFRRGLIELIHISQQKGRELSDLSAFANDYVYLMTQTGCSEEQAKYQLQQIVKSAQ